MDYYLNEKNEKIENYDKIVIKAFNDTPDTILTEKHSERSMLNLSSISTFLIQNVGRFCERFASDFLIDWAAIESTIDIITEAPVGAYKIIAFGIRRDGVDSNTFITCRIMENKQKAYSIIDAYYRAIYAVKIEKSKSEFSWDEIVVTLKNIQNTIKYDESLEGEKI